MNFLSKNDLIVKLTPYGIASKFLVFMIVFLAFFVGCNQPTGPSHNYNEPFIGEPTIEDSFFKEPIEEEQEEEPIAPTENLIDTQGIYWTLIP